MTEERSYWAPDEPGPYLGLVGGLALTAIAMGNGFIWAMEGRVLPVYLAATGAWGGYLVAHWAVTGILVDPPGAGAPKAAQRADENSSGLARLRAALPAGRRTAIGFLLGNALLVIGIAVLAVFVSAGNRPLATVGAGLFLAGYAIAHQFEAGIPL